MKNHPGLVTEMYSAKDIEKIIEINKLEEVTNPVYMTNGYPTEDGLLSYSIFGSSVDERKVRMAYMDLKGHYMEPIAALKLKAFDRRLNNILYGLERYKLVEGDLIEDDDGQTGPEYLYSIWDKVKKKEKNTILTKEVKEAFDVPRDNLFVTKFLILPVSYRDIRTGTNTIGMNSINDVYAQIISSVRNIETYTEGFDNIIQTATRGRVQSLLVDIYRDFILTKVKGQPSKKGYLKRNYRSKSIDYSSRSVIAARDLNQESVDDVQIKFGEIGIPLAQVCSGLYPFILFGMKRYFDNEFLRGGKYPYKEAGTGKLKYCTILRSYDEEEISEMIDNYISTPGLRFDPVLIPENDSGQDLKMFITGRLNKENTTLQRPATFTDVLYLVAADICTDKYTYTTRYPVTSINSQFTGKIVPLSTKNTTAITIGDKFYPFFPTVEGNPENAFMDVEVFSNTILAEIGGDHDGDTTSNKMGFSIETNAEGKRSTESIANLVDPNGNFMRTLSKEFILTSYMLTRTKDTVELKDINVKKPIYEI